MRTYSQKILSWISRLLGQSSGKIQTFTYYIPAPPPRKSGYREKEFDKIFYQFINRGYEVLNCHTTAHTGPQQSGMWVIFTVRSLSASSADFDLEFPAIKDDKTAGDDRPSVANSEDLYYE